MSGKDLGGKKDGMRGTHPIFFLFYFPCAIKPGRTAKTVRTVSIDAVADQDFANLRRSIPANPSRPVPKRLSVPGSGTTGPLS
jgi:hypothetical protein